VTLSGTVASDSERSAAAADAATVRGVKTVVNNLQVGPAVAQAAPAPEPVPVEAARPARTRMTPKPVAHHSTPRYQEPAPSRVREYNDTTSPSSAPVMAANVAPAAPLPPPPPARVSIPPGTLLTVRLVDSIDTPRNQAGDVFKGTLDAPIVVDDKVVVPADADVIGRVVELHDAGHYAGQPLITIELTRLIVNGQPYDLRTDYYSREGHSRGKRTAATVGGGAALGAIIGGIAGGGKGAAIGAAAGAGAGTAAGGLTKAEVIRLDSETVVDFRLQSSLSVTPVSVSNRNASRQRVEQ